MLPEFEATELPADAVEVGRIADAWGIKGWFKVFPHSTSPEALFSSKQWYLMPADKGPKTFAGALKLRVKEARDHSGIIVASAHEVEERSDAELLRGARVFVSRSSFPSTAVDEFYWVDLMGLEVVNRQGAALGRVTDLVSSAAQTVLVVQSRADGHALELMIPFVAAYIDAVDLPGRRITVDWQIDY